MNETTTSEFDELIGLTFKEIKGNVSDNEIILISLEGRKFQFYHEQDCCEEVCIEDIIGDLDDLINSPMLVAEKTTSESGELDENSCHFTWTFYRFSTVKGTVTIRWCGSSNGYYSEEVSFRELK